MARGLERAATGDLDAVLLDLDVRGGDRASIAEALSLAADVPIILLSNAREPSTEELEHAHEWVTWNDLDGAILRLLVRSAGRVRQLRQQLRSSHAQLSQSEERFVSVMSSMGDGIVVVDRNGRVLYVNEVAERLFGRSRDELVGVSFGAPIVYQERATIEVVDAAGTVHAVDMRQVPVAWESRPAYLATLRELENEVGQQQSFLHSAAKRSGNGVPPEIGGALETADHALILSDRGGTIRWMNRGAREMAQQTSAAACTALDELGLPEPVLDRLRTWLRERREEVREEIVVQSDDGLGFYDCALLPQGELAIIRVREISEQRIFERQQREEATRLRAAFHGAAIALILATTDGTVVDANLGAGKLLHCDRDDLRGLRLTELIHREDRGAFDQDVRRLLKVRTTVTREYRFRRVSTTLWGRVSLSLHPKHSDRARHLVCVVEDYNAPKSLEEQLLQAQKIEALGQLAGGVAHDFNNVLMACSGYIEMILKRTGIDETMQRYANGLSTAIERGSSLTSKLLAFSRKQQLQPSMVSLNGVLTDAHTMLDRLIEERVETVIRPDAANDRVRVDPGHLTQAIVNLVINARDAMPHGGKLTLETANVVLDQAYCANHPGVTPGPYAMLAVSDTGCGMDTATRLRVFEPFFTTKAEGEGTGLGLASVYGFVKQSGGHIWVYSEPERGSMFKIYLPVADNEEVEATTEPSVEHHVEPGTRVLVVEDDGPLRELIRESLHQAGYTVHVAADGSQAVAQLERGPVDVVLTDVVMPKLGGNDLASVVRERWPGVPILFMSGYTSNSVVHHDVLERGEAFVEKPFTQATLLRRLKELLDERRSGGQE
jgi:PAS domain S-box-containing protein